MAPPRGTVEIYKYLRDALKNLPFFADLRDTQRAELEKLFAEVQGEPVPGRGAAGRRARATHASRGAKRGVYRRGGVGGS